MATKHSGQKMIEIAMLVPIVLGAIVLIETKSPIFALWATRLIALALLWIVLMLGFSIWRAERED